MGDILRARGGILHLGHKKLNDDDFKRILNKLSSPRRERRPRKCQRLSGLDAILAEIPPTIWKFNVVGNTQIGNAGMEHLHLLPETVTDLDLSDCGLTAPGVRNVCDFLRTNKSVTRMIIWGNTIGDEGAKYIGEMLRVNKTLRILCIMKSISIPIGPVGFSHLSDGLTHNDTLRELSLNSNENVGDEHARNLFPGLVANRGLETLELVGTNITELGLTYFLQCARVNVYLKRIGMRQPLNSEDAIPLGPNTVWNELQYWLGLNRLNRKLIKDENSNREDWTNAVIQSSEAENLGAIYFFLRHKPEFLLQE
jgi:hypothetical protein